MIVKYEVKYVACRVKHLSGENTSGKINVGIKMSGKLLLISSRYFSMSCDKSTILVLFYRDFVI